MNATYRFTPDVRYYYASRWRYERQLPFLLRKKEQSLLTVGPILILWLVVRVVDPELEKAVRYLFIYGFVLYVIVFAAIEGALYWRIKANESKFTEITFTLSEEGVSASDAMAQSKIAWGAYPCAVRFCDGLMLLRTRLHRVWLPDSALHGATPDEVTKLVESKVRLQHVA